MPVKTFRPEAISWSITPSLDATVHRASDLDVSQIVVPYNVAHYNLDAYRIRNGWPVEVPPYDVFCVAAASAAGEIISYRPAPSNVTTEADVRWIPTELTWDDTSLTWRSEEGVYTNYVWQTSVDFAPTYIDDYTYRIGKEIVTRSALNFRSTNNEHMWSNFTGGFVGTVGYTAIMVLSLESRFGVDGEEQDWAGLLCAGHPTISTEDIFPEVVSGNNTNLQMRGRYLYANGGQLTAFQQMFPINLSLTRTQPSYLAITVDPPYTKVYMGFGAASMQKAQTNTGPPMGNTLNWVLGRATGDILHCADMTLFDMSLYATPLSDNDLLGEIATLSQAFGG